MFPYDSAEWKEFVAAQNISEPQFFTDQTKQAWHTWLRQNALRWTQDRYKMLRGYETFTIFGEYSPSQWATMSERTRNDINRRHEAEFRENDRILQEHRQAVMEAYRRGQPLSQEMLEPYLKLIEEEKRLAEQKKASEEEELEKYDKAMGLEKKQYGDWWVARELAKGPQMRGFEYSMRQNAYIYWRGAHGELKAAPQYVQLLIGKGKRAYEESKTKCRQCGKTSNHIMYGLCPECLAERSAEKSRKMISPGPEPTKPVEVSWTRVFTGALQKHFATLPGLVPKAEARRSGAAKPLYWMVQQCASTRWNPNKPEEARATQFFRESDCTSWLMLARFETMREAIVWKDDEQKRRKHSSVGTYLRVYPKYPEVTLG